MSTLTRKQQIDTYSLVLKDLRNKYVELEEEKKRLIQSITDIEKYLEAYKKENKKVRQKLGLEGGK